MYTAHVLSGKARKLVLDKFPPKFPDVIAHHVTVKFGVSNDTPIPNPSTIKVVGYVSDESLETLIVTVNGKEIRPDGKVYHVTLSLDKSKGRKAVQSNFLIESVQRVDVDPFEITTIPDLLK